MAGIAVTVLENVLEKLATLTGDNYNKVKNLREEVGFLDHELRDMNALLENMDDADELDQQAKNWRKNIIEMSYDIEDYIDDFTARVGEAGDNIGIFQKARHCLQTLKDRWHIASEIKKIKDKVIQASKRRKRYNLDRCLRSTTHVIVDPRLSTLYQTSEGLVGIEGQKEEIVKWVIDEEPQLKVMSIVGFGGLGKTTLANEVYREVGEKFDCKAFISISQNPDILKLLNSLMLQLGLQPYSHACQHQDLINSIIQRLEGKRYFIIVDDLWDDRQAWRTIHCAFPINNHHSRVMVTTRIENVARVCCGNHGFIHNMRPLSDQDSKRLFFSRIFGSEDGCPPDFKEVSHTILKKCAGLPLAIITMASMIACQPERSRGQWAGYILDSLATEFATKPTYEDMMQILELSYKNLPRQLKTCFLYLGTYPEDHKIARVDLVRRWVAEGFVSCSHGRDVWDVGESYFTELVNRSMIQPAYKAYDKIGIEVTQCRVHDMMLDLILRKCREDNFINLIDSPEILLKEQEKVIRRLTIDIRRGEEDGIMIMANTKHLSQVRSLNIFRGNFQTHKLTEFKFMRVLFLDVGNLNLTIFLTGINHLSLLRYLRARGHIGEVLVPAQIRGLRHLETLDLSGLYGERSGETLEIVDVPRLSHVSMPFRAPMRLPDGIGKVKSLLTLSGFHLTMSSLESITSLGELTDLSELRSNPISRTDIKGRVNVPMETLIAALITSLEKLVNLRNLTLWDCGTVYCGDAMQGPSFSPPFHKLETLDLRMLIFSGVPRWIGHLRCLRRLVLGAKQIHQEDLNVIGTELTSLVSLVLGISRVPAERIAIGGSTGFKVLKGFVFDCDRLSCLTFEAGAMPALQELRLEINLNEWDKAAPVGFQHLPCLKIINVWPAKHFTDELPGPESRVVTRDVFREATDALPTHPEVHVGEGAVVRPKEWGT